MLTYFIYPIHLPAYFSIFWSSVGGGLRYVGTGSGQDDIYVDGDLSKELKVDDSVHRRDTQG